MYYFRVNLGYDGKGKKVQKYCSGFTTKKEAREEYSRLMIEGIDEVEETPKTQDNICFKEYIESVFLPWYKKQVKENTYTSRLPSVNKHFPYFYDMAVCDIAPLDVQNWQLKLSKRYKPSYIRSVQGLFSLSMDRAILLNLATENPSKIVGNVKKQKAKVDFWTKDEFEKIISLIYKEDYFEHFIFISLWLLFMTGMRIGEATAVQWRDIDFSTGVLKINKTLYYKNQNDYTFSK